MARKNLGRVVGLSAYEVWLNNGNTGSEQDFLNSLKGRDGEPGTPGGTIDTYSKSEIDTMLSNISVSGGGLTDSVKQALINLFNHLCYTDASGMAYLSALQQAFGETPDEPEQPTTYTITNNLTNCTNSNNTSSIVSGSSYSATISANSEYTLGAVTCTMGGENVPVTNGIINISNVTGNIIIIATATKEDEPTPANTYTITNNLTNCVSNNQMASITEGSSYSAQISANSGYELGSITCTMGGTNIPVNNGNISIANVTGNIVITATATETQQEPETPYINEEELSNGWVNNTNYDLSNYTDGMMVIQNGAGTQSSGTYVVTDYLPCHNVPILETNIQNVNVVFYDENKNWISDIVTEDRAGTIKRVDSRAYFFRTNVVKANIDNLYIKPLAYKLLKEGATPQADTYYISELEAGIIGSSGNFAARDSSVCTKFMKCSGFSKIQSSHGMSRHAFYDASKKLIGTVSTTTMSEYTVPAGAYYFKASYGSKLNVAFKFTNEEE